MDISLSCLDSGYLLMYYQSPSNGEMYGSYVREAIIEEKELYARIKELIEQYQEEKDSE